MLLFLFRIPECLFKPGTFDIIVKKKNNNKYLF